MLSWLFLAPRQPHGLTISTRAPITKHTTSYPVLSLLDVLGVQPVYNKVEGSFESQRG